MTKSSPTLSHHDAVRAWQDELRTVARTEKIPDLSRFFKTGPGEYGEGDIFIGVYVPDNRAVATMHADEPTEVLALMLESAVHEDRLSALLAMVRTYARGGKERRDEILNLYLHSVPRINNWDLVDLSAPYLLGAEISAGRMLDELAQLSASPLLWARRIAVVATMHPIRAGHPEEALRQARLHLSDPEPLMHKAVGWMLREVGKRHPGLLDEFLSEHVRSMSATTLSYATEKFSKEERQRWRNMRKSN